ncbi:hypothetical protein ACFWYW_56205 [Nonomuraea sp. NPDC059023]|uniref:hypothetical protein n=1 Tax=unclassified Nonomuraea TaxID=2593643 RepID=UPI0036B4C789
MEDWSRIRDGGEQRSRIKAPCKLFTIGTVWFAVASALCGLAPTVEVLIAARALQGARCSRPARRRSSRPRSCVASGRAPWAPWSGLGGLASAIGPLLGGWSFGWRWVLLINEAFAGAQASAETRDKQAAWRFDVLGALALTAITYGLTRPHTPRAHCPGACSRPRSPGCNYGAHRTPSCQPACSATRVQH